MSKRTRNHEPLIAELPAAHHQQIKITSRDRCAWAPSPKQLKASRPRVLSWQALVDSSPHLLIRRIRWWHLLRSLWAPARLHSASALTYVGNCCGKFEIDHMTGGMPSPYGTTCIVPSSPTTPNLGEHCGMPYPCHMSCGRTRDLWFRGAPSSKWAPLGRPTLPMDSHSPVRKKHDPSATLTRKP